MSKTAIKQEKAEIDEATLRGYFDRNFQFLKMESGHALTEDMKELAWNHVKYYLKQMHELATSVTDTEINLVLPNRRTPKSKRFAIEGIVDIVRAGKDTRMYDIKTHEEGYIRDNIDMYSEQLSIYAYIWKVLRGNELDGTSVISTFYPESVAQAIRSGDAAVLDKALSGWNPLIDIPYDPKQVDAVVTSFGEIVDKIEDGEFAPPPVKVLQTKSKQAKQPFGVLTCRHCDARFSCSSYRSYAKAGKGGKKKQMQYFELFAVDDEREEAKTAILPTEY